MQIEYFHHHITKSGELVITGRFDRREALLELRSGYDGMGYFDMTIKEPNILYLLKQKIEDLEKKQKILALETLISRKELELKKLKDKYAEAT